MSRKTKIILVVVWIGLVIGTLWVMRPRYGPDTLREAWNIALENNLSVRGLEDGENNPDKTLTISKHQLSGDDSNLLTAFSPLAQWVGIARVSLTPPHAPSEYLLFGRWGKLWVIGDPDFVSYLITLRTP